MADMQIAAEPRCPVHGKMHYDRRVGTWLCHGWDGEGCDHVATTDDLKWVPVTSMIFRS